MPSEREEKIELIGYLIIFGGYCIFLLLIACKVIHL